MVFWIIVIVLAALVASLLILALLRGRPGAEPAAAYDLRVYRDQLAEVDRDLTRGLINDGDAERIRAEVSRRILAADAALQRETSSEKRPLMGTRVVTTLLAVVVVGGSALLYSNLGAPGYRDLSQAMRIEMAQDLRETRPSQAEAEADLPPVAPRPNVSQDYLDLVEKLRQTVAKRPDDLQGQTLLARNEAVMGNYIAAHKAQAEILRIKGDAAEASDYADLADMMILAVNGYVSPEAEASLKTALKLDPRDGPSRYYWGLMMAQTGRPDVAFRIWEKLLNESSPDAPWVPPIRANLEQTAARAGVKYTLPAATAPSGAPLAGPSAADVQAAGDMTDEERQAMIRSMVEQLSERLGTEGGSPQEWARLIGALGVLGDADRARAIYDNAAEVFAGNDAALSPIRDAARRAGVIE
jgi:cytochrome c-type biogenesis protein CcmH